MSDREYDEMKERESQTHYSGWLEDNREELVESFIDWNNEKFEEFCHEQYENEKEVK